MQKNMILYLCIMFKSISCQKIQFQLSFIKYILYFMELKLDRTLKKLLKKDFQKEIRNPLLINFYATLSILSIYLTKSIYFIIVC